MLELPSTALWRKVSKSCALSKAEFFQHYEGKVVGYAIGIQKAWQIMNSVGLRQLKAKRILPPQGYRYLAQSKVSSLIGG